MAEIGGPHEPEACCTVHRNGVLIGRLAVVAKNREIRKQRVHVISNIPTFKLN
jgi:hypothetical protein